MMRAINRTLKKVLSVVGRMEIHEDFLSREKTSLQLLSTTPPFQKWVIEVHGPESSRLAHEIMATLQERLRT